MNDKLKRLLQRKLKELKENRNQPELAEKIKELLEMEKEHNEINE